ncbi:hypothetical protein L2744_10270 [Shewanella profunda]|uniref:hypothetical protein n=1 Tax=Shewanella profunda TaxID=254793 RepID=UPI002010ACCD|nr:hypothetical protein [Shewanella profunda]MCL1089979.1 hypothetical protein [Shewanella profunda]
MYLSNAERWSLLCKKQIEVIDNLATQFPERKANLNQLSQCWLNVQHQVQVGDRPSPLELIK